ncbi:hypothetical protein NLG97_g11236 [Lecanicillium saksenae]|uniref:Uncharacterized protein n=1 Tax=Lecanicillium saksenae TaxID=468837 RepID=A0ACC1QB44_9HYPO|nr:hypothetical protein NLG97_g11236 [Lecanicillium saksenae]
MLIFVQNQAPNPFPELMTANLSRLLQQYEANNLHPLATEKDDKRGHAQQRPVPKLRQQLGNRYFQRKPNRDGEATVGPTSLFADQIDLQAAKRKRPAKSEHKPFIGLIVLGK